jgi:uncharacterized caspase-like protein
MNVRHTPAALALLVAVAAPAAADTHAVVVGVDRYQNPQAMGQPNLKYADGDAREVGKTLRSGGAKVTVLTSAGDDGQPTSSSANVRKALKALAAAAGEGDTLVVYFAGYERQFPGSGDYYLCTTDAQPKARQGMVALADVYEILEESAAGRKVVIVDACRGVEAGDNPARMRKPPRGISLLIACSAGQVAYETEKAGHGLFTLQVARGLSRNADANRDGQVTVAELATFVTERVPAYIREEKLDFRQQPELIGYAGTDVPLVTVPSR